MNNSKIYDNELFQKIYEGLSEHEHQRELFSWAAATLNYGFQRASLWASSHPQTIKRDHSLLGRLLPNEALRWLHSIPNGGSRGGDRAQRQREGSRMRSEGIKRGIADIFLPTPSRGHSGLYIELKKFRGGVLSKDQLAFSEHCHKHCYLWERCLGYWQAIEAIEAYLPVEN